MMATRPEETYVFTEENFRNPDIPEGLDVLDVPLQLATDEALKGLGFVISSADERTVEKKKL